MAKFRLSDIETNEVSLVPKGANNRKFFLVKSADGDHVVRAEEIIKELLKQPAEKIEEVCKNLEPAVKEALSAAFKLMQVVRDSVPEETINKLLSELNLGGSEPKEGEKQMPETKADATKKGAPEGDQANLEAQGAAKNTPAPEGDKAADVNKEAQKVEALMKENADLRKSHEELQKKFSESENARLTKEFVEKASEFKNLGIEANEFGPVLKTINEASTEAYDKVMGVLKAADKQLGESKVFESAGSDSKVAKSGAWDKIEKLAEGMVEKSTDGLTHAQAIDRVLKSDEGKKLYNEYMKEMGGAA